MKKLTMWFLALSTMIVPVLASSFDEVDFRVNVNNVDPIGALQPRLIAFTRFDKIQLATVGTFGVRYQITDVDSAAVLYDDTVFITAGQTDVIVGNANTGKVTLAYDDINDILEARFAIKAVQGTRYGVYVSDDTVSYIGRAEISGVVPF